MKGGGPAFPTQRHGNVRKTATPNLIDGMTLRQYYAGQTIIPLIRARHKLWFTALEQRNMAAEAFEIADAMIVAGEK